MLNHTDLASQLTGSLAAPHWYVGFSGGIDSTVLLHLLHQWCAANPGSPTLGAIHINHGLQSAADDWQRHCEEVCRSLSVPLITRVVDVQAAGSGEAAARAVRYEAFVGQLQPGAVLFLGHHLDDQVETFFLRLLRGAGVEGLAAMPRCRTLGAGHLVRPLLDYTRSELERYAAHHNLTYVEDPSNKDTELDRNFLRADLLPLLASRWPAYRQSVARASGHMAAVSRILEDEFGIPDTLLSVMGDPGLPLPALTDGSAEIAATRLRAWLRLVGYQSPDHAAVQEFLRQLREAAVDGKPRLVSGTYSLQRYRDGVYLLPEFFAAAPSGKLVLERGERLEVPGVGAISLQPSSGDGLELVPGERLEIHWRQGGERCRLPGRDGSQSLKTLMQDWQVPPWWRDRVPLVSLGDELLAVGDLSRCESSRWRQQAGDGELLWDIRWERPGQVSSD